MLELKVIKLLSFGHFNHLIQFPFYSFPLIKIVSSIVSPNGMILFLGLKLTIIDTIQINKHISLNYFVKVLPTLTRRNRQSLVSRFVIGNLVSLGIELKILIKILSNTPKS